MKLIKKFLQDVGTNIKKWFLDKWNKWNFRIAKAEAVRRSEQENRKVYVIQSSPVHYRVFSTAEIRHLKKIRVFKKELTFKEMTEKSVFVAYPKKMYN